MSRSQQVHIRPTAIYCIIIEATSTRQDKNKIFGELLLSNGFTYRERQRGNEVWINENYFRRELFMNEKI